ncbi:MAG: hypothetical protein CMJ12_03340 [Pelagibacterales bacterium]|nr:hypothetical protein [Pelagibacterales bacterium]PPR17203.1 MAG: hypothetical protein CFH33_00073 [Alphaproteobacteria bacterium MarineAlpha9_Bin3]
MSNNIKLIENNYSEEFRLNLINARNNKNLTIKEASKILNISEEIIIKLENGNFNKINDDIFIIGHIRTYLNLIDIDPKLLINNYQLKEVNLNKGNQNIIIPYKFKLSKKFILLISIILFFFILIVYKELNKLKTENIITNNNVLNSTEIIKEVNEESLSKKKELSDIDIIEKKEETIDVIDKASTATSTNKDIHTKPEEINFIFIEAKEDSWIEIQDINLKVLVSKIVKKNEIIKLPYQKDLILVTGNAGGIIIKVNNNTINALGKSGEVKRNISLNLENLIKYIEE